VFEYTAPGTPQQNGVIERAFATMLGKTRAIMNGAGLDEKKRHLFWTEAANTVSESLTIQITMMLNLALTLVFIKVKISLPLSHCQTRLFCLSPCHPLLL